MRPAMEKRHGWPSEEEAYGQFIEVFDLELFAMELEYNEKLAAAIREGVRSKLDARQKAFDTMLARHAAAVAENARRAEARRLEAERLKEIARRQREREENRRRAGARHLVRRWHAKLAPAHAS